MQKKEKAKLVLYLYEEDKDILEILNQYPNSSFSPLSVSKTEFMKDAIRHFNPSDLVNIKKKKINKPRKPLQPKQISLRLYEKDAAVIELVNKYSEMVGKSDFFKQAIRSYHKKLQRSKNSPASIAQKTNSKQETLSKKISSYLDEIEALQND